MYQPTSKLQKLIVSRADKVFKGALIAPNIPPKKLYGAQSAITGGMEDIKDILVVQDQTVLGSATDGVVCTDSWIYIKPMFQDRFCCAYTDIYDIQYVAKSLRMFDKVELSLKGGKSYTVDCAPYIDPINFVEWLKDVVEQAEHDDEYDTEYLDDNSGEEEQEEQFEFTDVEAEDLPTTEQNHSARTQNLSAMEQDWDAASENDSYDSEDEPENAPENDSEDDSEDVHHNRQTSSRHSNLPAKVESNNKAKRNNKQYPQLPKPQLPDGLTPDLFILLTKEYKYGLKDSYGAPDIPERKLNGAVSGITDNEAKPDEILFVADDTIFGGGDVGLAGTQDSLFFKESFELSIRIDWLDIKDVYLKQTGKSADDQQIILSLKNGNELWIPKFIGIFRDINKVAIWLKAVVDVAHYENLKAHALGEDNAPKSVLKSLEQMPRESQYIYMQIISNYMLADDGKITPREAGLLYSLLSRISLTAKDRYNLRIYQSSPDMREDTQDLVNKLNANLSRVSQQYILNSLVKDMVNIHVQAYSEQNVYLGNSSSSAQDDDSYLHDPFIMRFARANGIEDQQLKFIKQVIDADNKIFDDNVDDEGLNSALSSLAATAGAVGVPLAALYFSGSVVGLSAAGISSGLAALGLGGLFGLSSMATGLGAMILIGLGANKGIKKLTGQDERDKRARKQALLFAVNRQLTKSINLLAEDVNTFTQELSKQIKKAQALEQDVFAKEQVLSELLARIEALSTFSSGNELLVQDSRIVETKAYRQNLPINLDIEKLRAITDEPTKQQIFENILALYDQREVTEDGKVVTRYILKDDLICDEAEFLSTALDKLGYYDLSGVAKGGLASIKSLWN